MEYIGVDEIKNNLVILENVTGAMYDEIVHLPGAPPRLGRVIQIDGDVAVVLVFEGTRGLVPADTRVKFTGRLLEMRLSEEILGRVFDGLARPRDGLGEIFSDTRREISGTPLNPAERIYPRDYIHTGVSAIDGLATLIRGQKLAIFSADGLPHDKLAAQIAVQAGINEHTPNNGGQRVKTNRNTRPYLGKIFSCDGHAQGTVPVARKDFPDGAGLLRDMKEFWHPADTPNNGGQGGLRTGAYKSRLRNKSPNNGGQGGLSPCGGVGAAPPRFSVVFAAMGIQNDTADFFRNALEESGQFERTVMYLNMASDPPAERIATPRFALTAAEYLAFECGYHVLVILTDMTAYAETLRELSSARGEIPGRKGFPGYMYSDLASIYERAGLRRGKSGSVTQIPILTMPGEDITHPIPDLSGYITEGQIVLSGALHRKGIYPPIAVLPSLSRLMKDGIGENFTAKEHPALAAKIFAAYAEGENTRALAAVVGEDDLSAREKKSLAFAHRFEEEFLSQEFGRSMGETLALMNALQNRSG